MATKSISLNNVPLFSQWSSSTKHWSIGEGSLAIDFGLPAGSVIKSAELSFATYGAQVGVLKVNSTVVDVKSPGVVQLSNLGSQTVSFTYQRTESLVTTKPEPDYVSITVKSISATVTYEAGTQAPQIRSAALSAQNATADMDVTLSWVPVSAATPSTVYEWQFADSENNNDWGPWTAGGTVTGLQTIVHPAAAVGTYRRFRIRAVAGETEGSWYRMEQTLLCTSSYQPVTEPEPVPTMMPYRVVHIWRRIK